MKFMGKEYNLKMNYEDLENNKLDLILNKLDRLENSVGFMYRTMTYGDYKDKISVCCCNGTMSADFFKK